MKLSKLFIAMLAMSCLSAASAFAWGGTHYAWSGSDCGEYTSGGTVIRWVDRDNCRNSAPTHYAWSGSDCGEYTPGGAVVQWINRDSCRNVAPSHYAWSGSDCGEYTPGGAVIQWVNRDTCRNYYPTHYAWSGSDCGEYTPGGSVVQWVGRDYCRYSMNEVNGTLKGTSAPGSDLSSAIAELESPKSVQASELPGLLRNLEGASSTVNVVN